METPIVFVYWKKYCEKYLNARRQFAKSSKQNFDNLDTFS